MGSEEMTPLKVQSCPEVSLWERRPPGLELEERGLEGRPSFLNGTELEMVKCR